MSRSSPEQAFRKELIDLVAYRSPWARRWVTRGRDPSLASSLGLDEVLLDEAGALLRSGFLPKERKGKGENIVLVDVFMPAVMVPEFMAVCDMVDMLPSQLIRSVLHTMMQTQREPSERTPRRWTPSGEARKVKGFGFRGRRTPFSGKGRKHIEAAITTGLHEALGRRAAAYGATTVRYALLWCADLIDGLLADVAFPPVSTDQMFDSAEAYVLPVVEVAAP